MKYQLKDGNILCDGHAMFLQDVADVLNNLKKENDNYRAIEAERKAQFDKVTKL